MRKEPVSRYIEIPNCNFCGSVRRVLVFKSGSGEQNLTKISVSTGAIGSQNIVRCLECGLMYANPQPGPELLERLYAEGDETVYASQKSSRELTFSHFIEKSPFVLGNVRSAFDVGAGGSFFLQHLKRKGISVEGVEPSDWLRKFSVDQYGIKLVPGLFRDYHGTKKFDLISFWDVLEHSQNPSADLQKASAHLCSNGRILINIPDPDSVFAKVFRSRWWFFISVHLFHFPQDTLNRKMKELGFILESRRRHFQVLELGHIARMAEMYNPVVGKLLYRVLHLLDLHERKLKYYAGQKNYVFKKIA